MLQLQLEKENQKLAQAFFTKSFWIFEVRYNLLT